MNQWYGYLHTNGSLHAKRYLGDPGDIEEARNSPFVKTVIGPFEAADREHALAILRQKLANSQVSPSFQSLINNFMMFLN